MQFISIILLTVVGLIAAREWFASRFPQLKSVLEDIKAADSLIGVAALVLGILWFLVTLRALFDISFAPIYVLLSLVGSGLLGKLGFVLCAPLLNEQLFKNNDKMRSNVALAQEKIEKYREKMGVAAVIISSILLVIFISGAGV